MAGSRQEARIDERPDGDAGEEEGQDGREDVAGTAGTRRQDASPQVLVAQRSKAGDEGQHQRQPGTGRSRREDDRSPGCRGRTRWRRWHHLCRALALRPEAQKQSRNAGRCREAGPDQQRLAQSDQLDQEQAGSERSDDRAERVDRVEAAEFPTHHVVVSDQIPRQRGKRGTHQDRGRAEGRDREGESDQGEHRRVLLERGECAAVDLMQAPECGGGQQDGDDYQQLEDGVHPQRIPDAVGQAPSDNAADCHPAEEACQDGRDRLGRVAEDQDQLASPYDFVHQASEPRQQEDEEDHSPACRGESRWGSLLFSHSLRYLLATRPGTKGRALGFSGYLARAWRRDRRAISPAVALRIAVRPVRRLHAAAKDDPQSLCPAAWQRVVAPGSRPAAAALIAPAQAATYPMAIFARVDAAATGSAQSAFDRTTTLT